MTTAPRSPQDIRQFILEQVSAHPKDISRLAAERFSITRQAAARHVSQLVREGSLTASGTTKAREYRLATLVSESFHLTVTPKLDEHRVWRETIASLLSDVKDNVRQICEHGVTEMVNNVIEHSGSKTLDVQLTRTASKIRIVIADEGIGIFTKIQQDFGLNDARDALLELSKGKLTSAQANHSGEGIFFTSRMFDTFSILSSDLFFNHSSAPDEDWLIEAHAVSITGTAIAMEISVNATRTAQQVFDEYIAEHDEYGFTRTHVPIKLARYDTDQLVSRSQARRVLARFDKFREVTLDFKDVLTIGQAFADEIFRVYRNAHPNVTILPLHTTSEIDRMILHVTIAAFEERPGTPNN